MQPSIWTDRHFWRYGVLAGLVAAGIWWFGGLVMGGLAMWGVELISVGSWPAVREWFHDLGWLAFLITAALWFVRTKLAPPQIGSTKRDAISGFLVESAVYGIGQPRDVDVTEAVMKQVQNGCIDIVVSHKTFGLDDPVPGQRKRLKVVYLLNGDRRKAEAAERERLKIP